MRTLAALGCALLLAGCGGEEYGDLKQELVQLSKDLRGKVDPLPQVRPYEPADYKEESQLDPFVPGRIVVSQAQGGGGGGALQPDLNRPKEPLEAFPLDAIQMVGTLTMSAETYALVRAGPNLFRVKRGNYLGQNYGLITSIDDTQISLKEVVQDSAGDWVERANMLQMAQQQEARK
jgi:type IV pilus assembly protein PilP